MCRDDFTRTCFYAVAILLWVAFMPAHSSAAQECDGTDPVCVVSLVFERSLMLRYDEIEEYACEESLYLVEVGKTLAKNEVKKKKKKGIDFYKQTKFDMSGLQYRLFNDNGNTRVEASGSFVVTLDGTDFRHEGRVSEIHTAVKEEGLWKWCGYVKKDR